MLLAFCETGGFPSQRTSNMDAESIPMPRTHHVVTPEEISLGHWQDFYIEFGTIVSLCLLQWSQESPQFDFHLAFSGIMKLLLLFFYLEDILPSTTKCFQYLNDKHQHYLVPSHYPNQWWHSSLTHTCNTGSWTILCYHAIQWIISIWIHLFPEFKCHSFFLIRQCKHGPVIQPGKSCI